MRKISLVSDIKQAFPNITIAEEHRDLLRFLWYENFDADDPEVIILRSTRAVFGLKSSPFLMNGTISGHVSQDIVNEVHNVEVLKKLLRNLYVDDSTTSFNSFNQGVEFYIIAKKRLSNGGFDLRKWATNDPKLRDYINNHEQSLESSEISENELTYVENELGVSDNYRKVLGLNWNIDKDIFVFEFSDIAESGLGLVYTERNSLKISASFFDPWV